MSLQELALKVFVETFVRSFNKAGPKGWAYPFEKDVAARLGTSWEDLIRAVNILVSLGLVKQRGAGQRYALTAAGVRACLDVSLLGQELFPNARALSSRDLAFRAEDFLPPAAADTATPTKESSLSMEIFISWSGPISKPVAIALRNWLPAVLQRLDEPWMSGKDIRGGDYWDEELKKHLRTASFSIVCVTPDNQDSPWLNYEAGAISTRLEGRTCPFVLGLDPGSIKGPLQRLQGVPATEEGTKRLLTDINALMGAAQLGESVLDRVFRAHWPDLRAALAAIDVTAAIAPSTVKPPVVVPPLSDEDASNILESWFKDRPHEANLRVVRYSEVDRELSLPAGTAKRLLPGIATALAYRIKKDAAETLLLEEVPLESVISDDRIRW